MLNTSNNHRGFTLIELMVAIAIGSMVLAGIYSAFVMQQRSQISEQVAVDMQQTLRAAIYLMERDIRMAGFDPTRTWGLDGINNDGDADTDEADEQQNDRTLDNSNNDCEGAADDLAPSGDDESMGIKFAGPHKIRLNMDLSTDADGNVVGDRDYCDPGELIEYGFANTYDADGDGVADLNQGGAAPMGRATGAGSLQPMAEDMQAVAFAYAYDYDDGEPPENLDRRLDTSPGGHVIWAVDSDDDKFLDRILDTNDDGVIDGNDTPGGQDLIGMAWEAGYVPISRIRAVRIWLLARTRVPLRNYTDTATYIVGDKHIDARDTNRDGVVNTSDKQDNYKRRLLTATVKCRNLGL
jgi:type IV pilus assembly protein PilW